MSAGSYEVLDSFRSETHSVVLGRSPLTLAGWHHVITISELPYGDSHTFGVSDEATARRVFGCMLALATNEALPPMPAT